MSLLQVKGSGVSAEGLIDDVPGIRNALQHTYSAAQNASMLVTCVHIGQLSGTELVSTSDPAEYKDAAVRYYQAIQIILFLALSFLSFRSEAALRVSMPLHAAQHNHCISA